MTAAHGAALALLWAGVACVLLAAAALVLLPGPYSRLHALAPANGLGVVLIALSVAVEQGPGRAAVKTLLIGLLMAVGGTVSTIAVGNVTTEAPEAPAETGAGRRD
ncbi:monovalent cation/H(+) antiporter subunit G [Streptomyces sp. NPDC048269]|uniref:monovalent cation/H(+) antiporter subunit G n=1 Tax=Streptomyces sp. NPDC048269 TaxID=3155753 RepID=UPI003425A7B7